MSVADCRSLVERLAGFVSDGYTIVTWNGASFDFFVLAQESGMLEQCGPTGIRARGSSWSS